MFAAVGGAVLSDVTFGAFLVAKDDYAMQRLRFSLPL